MRDGTIWRNTRGIGDIGLIAGKAEIREKGEIEGIDNAWI